MKCSTWGQNRNFRGSFTNISWEFVFPKERQIKPLLFPLTHCLSLSRFDLKSALLFDDPSRYQRCSRRLKRVLGTLLKYQPRQWEARQKHISHIRLNASANISCLWVFSVCGVWHVGPQDIHHCADRYAAVYATGSPRMCGSQHISAPAYWDCCLCQAFILTYIRLKIVIVVARMASLCKNVIILLKKTPSI